MAGNRLTGRDEPTDIKEQDESPTGVLSEQDESPTVMLTLSPSQVDQVVRLASGDGAPSMNELLAAQDLSRSRTRRVLADRYRLRQDDRRLSRSLLAGLLVLACFPPGDVELGIKDIAEQLELGASTVHRYVATLHAAGLLERDPVTRRYRLTVG